MTRYRCEDGHENESDAKLLGCPEITGGRAPDALVMPRTCGKPVKALRPCKGCGTVTVHDYCDDCWSDKQGGYTEE